MKACTKCGRELPLSAFGKHSLSKDGLTHRCKDCARKHSKEYRHTGAGVYTGIKGRTGYYKRKEVHISKEDFVEWHDAQPRVCEYCGISEEQLWLLQEHYGSVKDRLTVDCMNNAIGYSRGNLVLACDKCNQIKNNVLSYGDMKYIGENFIRPKWERWLEGR